jgi:uncharacterized membrane protein YphA (DoxX/SURF4 family)
MLVVSTWLRIAIGLIVIAAACSKIRGFDDFRGALGEYHLLRNRSSLQRIVASFLPPLELIAGVLLASAIAPNWLAVAVAFPLLVLLTIAVFENARRGLATACGCGIGRSTTSYPLVLRNLLLLILLAASVVIAPHGNVLNLRFGTGNLLSVYAISLVTATVLTYAPALAEEVFHQLGHVQ